MSIKFRRTPHKFSFASSRSILRCECLEARLAFSTSNALSWSGIAGLSLSDPLTSEITNPVKIEIVEEQETATLPGDQENTFDVDRNLEYDNQQLVEDDQIVWYMPWFGDESDGPGDLLYDDAGEFVEALSGKYDFYTPYDVSYSPIYYLYRMTDDDETGTLFPPPESEDFHYATDSLMMDCVALWDSGVVDVTSSGTVESYNILIWSTGITGGIGGANLSLPYSHTGSALAGSILHAPPPATMPPFGFALAPDMGSLQLYWPSGISTSDNSEKKESPGSSETT